MLTVPSLSDVGIFLVGMIIPQIRDKFNRSCPRMYVMFGKTFTPAHAYISDFLENCG